MAGLKRALQCRVATPLFLALSFMIIAGGLIIIFTYQDWVDLVKDTLLEEDLAHMKRYVQSVAITQRDTLQYATGEIFMVNFWLDYVQEKGNYKIQTESYYKPQLNSGYDIYNTYGNSSNYTTLENGMWWTNNAKDTTESQLNSDQTEYTNKMEVCQILLEEILREPSGQKKTAEVIFQDESYTFELPTYVKEKLGTLSYDYNDTCDKQNSNYDSMCEDFAYRTKNERKEMEMKLFVYNDGNSRFCYWRKYNDEDLVACQLWEYAIQKFVTTADENQLKLDGGYAFMSIEDELIAYANSSYEYREALLSDKEFEKKGSSSEKTTFTNDIIPHFNESYEGEYYKDGKKYYIVSQPVLALGNEEIYSLFPDQSKSIFYHTYGLIAAEDDLQQKFDEMVDDVKLYLIIMLIIFIILIILVLILACILIHLVTKRFVQPLEKLIKTLNLIKEEKFEEAKEELRDEQNKYKEFNKLRDFFPKFCLIYQFAKKEFFENDEDTLIKNYNAAKNLFVGEKNYLGAAICCNNLGNVYCKKASKIKAPNEPELLEQYRNDQNQLWESARSSYNDALDQIKDFKKNLNQYKEYVQTQMNDQTDKQNEYISLIDQYSEFIEHEDMVNRRLQMALANLQKLDLMAFNTQSKQDMKTSNKQNWYDLISKFEEILGEDIKHRKHFERVIWIMLHISLCYQMIREMQTSAKWLAEAERWLIMIENKKIKIDTKRVNQLNQVLQPQSKLNEEEILDESQKKILEKNDIIMDFEGSVDILRQRLMLYRALLFKTQGRMLEASQLLTLLIQIGEYYDPMIRYRALQELSDIFKEQNLESQGLQFLLDQHSTDKKRDFVFVLYVNESMSDAKGELAKDISYLQQEVMTTDGKMTDQVALISFWEKPVVELELKVDNDKELFRKFDTIDTLDELDKRCCLYDAIAEAFRLLQYSTNKKYVVVITDEEDYGSKIVDYETIKKKLQTVNVMLIVIAIQKELPTLKELTTSSESAPGLYLFAPDGSHYRRIMNEICGVLGVYKYLEGSV